MKQIKLFTSTTPENVEHDTNEFMKTVYVVDVKISECIFDGDDVSTTIMVVYVL